MKSMFGYGFPSTSFLLHLPVQIQQCISEKSVAHWNTKGSGLTWPYWGSWKPIGSDGYQSSQGPLTDLHSTKLRCLFSCHFHWVEGHSASSIKWLGPFKGLKRTKLSSLRWYRLTTKIGMKQREGGGEHEEPRDGARIMLNSSAEYIYWQLIKSERMQKAGSYRTGCSNGPVSPLSKDEVVSLQMFLYQSPSCYTFTGLQCRVSKWVNYDATQCQVASS